MSTPDHHDGEIDVHLSLKPDEAERLRQWKAKLALDSSSDEDDHAHNLRNKYALPQKPVAPAEPAVQWDAFGQVREVTEQNVALLTELAEKKQEIKKLEELLIAVEPIPGLDPSQLLDLMENGTVVDKDPRDAKILDLAKKNRNLSRALQKERLNNANLGRELEGIRQETESRLLPQKLRQQLDSADEMVAGPDETELQQQVKTQEQQLRQANQKAEALRVKLEHAQSEAKALQRALAKEVGDDVALADIMGEDVTWKGRQQKIIMLKAKVNRLETALKEAQHSPAAGSGSGSGSPLPSVADHRSHHEARGAERDRQKRVLQLEEELEGAHRAVEGYKSKSQAAKARTAVLEKEQKKLRGHVTSLLGKADTDDQLIKALRAENNTLRSQLVEERRSAGPGSTATMSRLGQSGGSSFAGGASQGMESQAMQETQRLSQIQGHQQRQLGQQETIIRSLKQELTKARDKIEQLTKPKRPSSADIRQQAEQELRSGELEGQTRMTTMENMKLKELVNTLRQQLRDAEAQQEEYITRVSELEIRCSEQGAQPQPPSSGPSDRQRAPRHRGSASGADSKGRPPSAPQSQQTAQLQQRVNTLQKENAALRATFQKSLQAREEEVNQLREALSQKDTALQEALAGMRSRLQHPGGDSITPRQMAGGAEVQKLRQQVARLQQDNELLHRELDSLCEEDS